MKWYTFIRSGISHPFCYGYILYKAKTCQYSPQKLIKPLNRLIKKGYSYDTVARSLKIAYFGIYLKNSCWHDTGMSFSYIL